MLPTQINLPEFRRALAPLRVESLKAKHLKYSGDPKIDELIHSNPFAFLIGVISDQMVSSERAWRVPFLLKERLGKLDPKQIARMTVAQLERVIRKPYSLHRFPRIMANYFIKAAQTIIQKYKGDVKNIWDGIDSACEIQKRLLEVPGVSQKKSSTRTKMLIRDWDLKINDLHTIDLPYDIHIRRVLVRAGLAEHDSLSEIQKAGQAINPNYPADYDDAIWLVGRRFCHPQNPDHRNCPLNQVCQKLDKSVESK